MIDVSTAYTKIRKRHPLSYVTQCAEFPKFYLFMMRPYRVGPNEPYYTGTQFDAVDKTTGRIFLYNITEDPAAYKAAKWIEVDNIMNRKVKG